MSVTDTSTVPTFTEMNMKWEKELTPKFLRALLRGKCCIGFACSVDFSFNVPPIIKIIC